MTYTSATSTGTSTNGPTVLASACPLSVPYTATTTAIASSKLLLAAVKDWVQLGLYAKPNFLHVNAVAAKTTRK